MSIDPRTLLANSGQVPSLPLIYNEISAALHDPNCSALKIADVISKDTGMAGRLLRFANSSLFGFPSKLDTISQAIIVIGCQQIADLAMGTCVMRMFGGISRDLVNMDSFWRHSVACGITARILATHRRESNVERFFVTGLLHDIGRLIIYMKIPDQARATLVRCKSKGELLYEAEREILGFNHADMGGTLLESWKLPPSLVEGVFYHHHPLNAVHFRLEPALIHVADIIANSMQLGTSGEKFVPPLTPEAWDRLNLSTSVLEPTMHEVDRQFEETIDMFLT